MDTPTIGRIVWYTGVNGEVVPAIVTAVGEVTVELTVFYPGMTPVPASSVSQGEGLRGCWFWPPIVPAKKSGKAGA